jgi:hypothetical protein
MTVNLLRAHDAVRRRLAEERGQGTVEYVGVILLVAGVLAGVVLWSRKFSGKDLGSQVTEQLKNAINQTSSRK